MLYLTSWLVWKFSSKIALMTAGWQSCSCLDLNGKTQLEFESVVLKWNCLLQAELSHGGSNMNERRGRGGGCAFVGGRLWGFWARMFHVLSLWKGNFTALLQACSRNSSFSQAFSWKRPYWVWGWQGLGAEQLRGTEQWHVPWGWPLFTFPLWLWTNIHPSPGSFL